MVNNPPPKRNIVYESKSAVTTKVEGFAVEILWNHLPIENDAEEAPFLNFFDTSFLKLIFKFFKSFLIFCNYQNTRGAAI